MLWLGITDGVMDQESIITLEQKHAISMVLVESSICKWILKNIFEIFLILVWNIFYELPVFV